jgi:hypothetical protein
MTGAMSKPVKPKEQAPRRNRVRATGEIIGDIGGPAFKRFGFVQSAVVSRWKEIVGERYAKVSLPESIRFPAGKKAGGTLTLLVEGAHAPLVQHLGPMIIERVNRFFGYQAIAQIAFRQGRLPASPPRLERGRMGAVPAELGEGLRAIADPELRACLESLAGHIAGSNGPPAFGPIDDTPIPIIRSKPK